MNGQGKAVKSRDGYHVPVVLHRGLHVDRARPLPLVPAHVPGDRVHRAHPAPALDAVSRPARRQLRAALRLQLRPEQRSRRRAELEGVVVVVLGANQVLIVVVCKHPAPAA